MGDVPIRSDSAVNDDYAFVAELYDYVVPYATRGDVEFFVEESRAAKGSILEVGCGTGRVLIPTARAGLTIVGLDYSAAMLTRCRAKLEEEPADVRARVELHEGDMRDFALGQRFALVTIPFRPFQHLLTVDDQLACLTSIHRHLEPGGRLILDLFNPSLDYLANRPVGEVLPEGPPVDLPDGRRLERHFCIKAKDRFTQVNDVELLYDVTNSDGRKRRPFGLRRGPVVCRIRSEPVRFHVSR